jgi:conjugal transfer pilus assembly protein TraW
MVVKRWRFLIFSFFLYPKISAENLGVFGETFNIDEPDLMEQIHAKLTELQKNGKLENIQNEIQKRVVSILENPIAVKGIIHTEVPRTFEFDPTVKVTTDLKDHSGKIFAKKGEYFNPLDQIKMTKIILFLDGDDESHIKWALSKVLAPVVSPVVAPQAKVVAPQAKVILVKGSPIKLQKYFHQPIYFDQYGILTAKLGVRQVPAMVWQEQDKKVLTVTEEFP